MAETRGSSTPGRPADPLLDFLSPEFSAEKALVSSPSRIRLPCPEVQPCDNLGHYTSVVQGLSRRREATSSRGEVKEEESERVAVRGRKKPVKTVMSVMETPQLGPLSLVQRCYSEGGRVRVVVRHCGGVRGECVGTVLAFDKHLNLVLGNVCEEYVPFRTVANGGRVPRSHRKRQRHKEKSQRACSGEGEGEEGQRVTDEGKVCRQVDKLFIRGDNLILISPTPSAAMPPSSRSVGHDLEIQ